MGRATRSSRYASRGGAIWLLLFAGGSSAQAAEGGPDAITDDLKRACVAQHEAAQLLRRAGKLTEARATMLACSQKTCPSIVSADCTSWLSEMVNALPSVIVHATTGSQNEDNVSVTVDGKLLAARLDGRPIEMDPGVHIFRFEAPAHDAVEQQVTLAEGEKDRPVNITFARPEPYLRSDVVRETYRPMPTIAYVMGGVGAAGLVVFAGFGLWGVNERMSLESSCSPSCSNSQLSSVRTKLLLADVGLGTAVLSLVAGTYSYLKRPTVVRQADARSGSRFVPGGATTMALAPLPSGVVFRVEGRF